MEKEFLGLVESALKAADTAANVNEVSAADKRPEVCRCVSLLKKLKDFPVSFDILASTQADKRLRHLRNHNKEKIRLIAKWVLETWSVIIKEGLSRNQKNGVSVTISVEPINTRNKTRIKRRKHEGEVRVEKPIRETKLCKQQEEKHQQKIKCSDALRNKVREVLLEGLRKVSGEVSEEENEEMKEKVRSCDPVSVSVSIESVMFKKLGPFDGANKLKYRSILFNVKDPKNVDFRRRILLGELNPERVVNMKTEEMASDERQTENMLSRLKAMAKIQKSVKEEDLGESVGSKTDKEALWLESMK